jgi:stage III sporulation protein SpoIIIAA
MGSDGVHDYRHPVIIRTRTDDLHLLIATLPQPLGDVLGSLPEGNLLEIVMDLGRPPQARLTGGVVRLAETPVTRQDLEHVLSQLGRFSADNRAGIEGTLHRISAIRNRRNVIIGLTLRVGRTVFGTIDLIRDLVEGGANTLLLGRPGVGKTTKLREIARVLADELHQRVIVVDTSNEIGGDGDIPHPAIGAARRMQVPHPDRQHAVMIEAVENHMPEVIIVDEIGTTAEAVAARTIAERGVRLIGTAHGNTLENIVKNPTLCDLVGGIQTVTLGDEEARLRGTQKTVNERKSPPTFDAVVEIATYDEVVIHPDTALAVDRLLRGDATGAVRRSTATLSAAAAPAPQPRPQRPAGPLPRPQGRPRIYPYALSPDSVERALRELNLDGVVVARPERANLILALGSRAEDGRVQRIRDATGASLQRVKKNSTAQIRRALESLFNVVPGIDAKLVAAAVRETEDAVRRVLEEGVPVALEPCSPALRQLQHRISARHFLVAESVGSEPNRHLVIYPHDDAATDPE